MENKDSVIVKSAIKEFFMCFTVQCFDLSIYDVACSFGVENMGNFTFKCAIKKCFNFGVYYVACSYCVENMDNFTLKCAIRKRIKVLRTR